MPERLYPTLRGCHAGTRSSEVGMNGIDRRVNLDNRNFARRSLPHLTGEWVVRCSDTATGGRSIERWRNESARPAVILPSDLGSTPVGTGIRSLGRRSKVSRSPGFFLVISIFFWITISPYENIGYDHSGRRRRRMLTEVQTNNAHMETDPHPPIAGTAAGGSSRTIHASCSPRGLTPVPAITVPSNDIARA